MNKACPWLPPPQSPSYCPAMALVTTFSLAASLPLTEGTDIHFSPDFHHSFSNSGGLIKVSSLCCPEFPEYVQGTRAFV